MAYGKDRPSRTEIDIKRAFLEILGHKPLTDITVSEVARKAHVSRSTFYLHYSDVSQVFDVLVRDIVRSTWEGDASSCAGCDAGQSGSAADRSAFETNPANAGKGTPSRAPRSCGDGSRSGHPACCGSAPLCVFARESLPYRAVVHEDRFIPSLVQNRELMESSPLVRTLVECGYSFQAACGILMFQVSGCFAASVQTRMNDKDWKRMREVIDLFIEGGVEKLKENAPGR